MTAVTLHRRAGVPAIAPEPAGLPGGQAAGRTSFTAWGMPVEIIGPSALLPGARALVHRLERLWNPTLPDSDLHRLYALVGTMVTVEPETVALVELATRAAWRAPQPAMGLRDVVIDGRRNRVGLPAEDLLDFRATAPALTAALLTRYLQEHGAVATRVRVGDAVREVDSHPQVA